MKRPAELAAAWRLAWDKGERWREKVDAGCARLPDQTEAPMAGDLERFGA